MDSDSAEEDDDYKMLKLKEESNQKEGKLMGLLE